MIKKKKKKVDNILYCQFTKQNSIFTLTDLKGQVKITLSNGMNGFKNSKSKTKFATQFTAQEIAKKAKLLGYKYSILIIKGKNKGRKKCFKFFKKGGLKIRKFIDQTRLIHNGCRPSKKPRL
jgi:small subunit ribosomal protein S11